jgi:linoleoyl-CoA desaturase
MSTTKLHYSEVKFSENHNEEFYKTLRSRVMDYFKTTGKSRHSNTNMVAKTIVMAAMYFIPFVLIITVIESNLLGYLAWVLMGFGMAGIGLSVMHDANHSAYSKNDMVNRWVGNILLTIGGSPMNWRIQHNVLHHTFTNVDGIDEDIDPGKVMRFSPHKERLAGHKYQHIYAWFLYGMMTFLWITTKDFKQLNRYEKMDLLKTQGFTYRRAMLGLIISKALYIGLTLGLPLYFSSVSPLVIIGGFLTMHFICGVWLGIIFQPAHVVPSSNYPTPDKSGNIEADWAVSQLFNTANFAPGARIFSWYVGGLNYQVEHHLFPNICHVHYRNISKIVSDTAKEYQLPYNSFRTFGMALKEHGKMLYNLGHYDNAPGLH